MPPDPHFHDAVRIAAFPMLCLIALGLSGPAAAVSLDDPLDQLGTVPAASDNGRSCATPVGAQPLALPDVIDAALCRNPQTASAWAAARARAAGVGTARSAYLPTISASGSLTRDLTSEDQQVRLPNGQTVNSSSGGSDTSSSASVSLNYVLFDFGARGAALDAARAQLDAASESRNAVLQSVYLAAVSAWYDWVSATGALDAARSGERAAQASFDAASAREKAGTVTKADRLQAQTALAQAQLTRVQAEGALRTSLGALANVMGLPANARYALAPAPLVEPAGDYTTQLDALVDTAVATRPDLASARAGVTAAEADIRSARASDRPTLSGSVSQGYSDTGDSSRDSASAGLNLSIPIFTGFATTYRVRAAEASRESDRKSVV
jgi:outer membrane protein TolC